MMWPYTLKLPCDSDCPAGWVACHDYCHEFLREVTLLCSCSKCSEKLDNIRNCGLLRSLSFLKMDNSQIP